MLSETQSQIQALINKIDLLTHIIQAASITTEAGRTKADEQVQIAVAHKTKLVDEILRLLGSKD